MISKKRDVKLWLLMEFDDRDDIMKAYREAGRSLVIKLETLNPFKLKEILESIKPSLLTERVDLIKQKKDSICQAISDPIKNDILFVSEFLSSTKTYENYYGNSIDAVIDINALERQVLDPINMEQLKVIQDLLENIRASDVDSINSNRHIITKLNSEFSNNKDEITKRENITVITDEMGLPDISTDLLEIADQFNELDSSLNLQLYYDVKDAEEDLMNKIISFMNSNLDENYSADDFSKESNDYVLLLINSDEFKFLMKSAQTFITSLQNFILKYTSECSEIAATIGHLLPYIKPPHDFWENALSDISVKFPQVRIENISAEDLKDTVISLALDQNSLLLHCRCLEIDFVSNAQELASISALSIHADGFEDESF